MTDQGLIAEFEVVGVAGIDVGRKVDVGDVDLDVFVRWRVNRPSTANATL